MVNSESEVNENLVKNSIKEKIKEFNNNLQELSKRQVGC